MYDYNATLIAVIDGDTVDLDIDLGLDIHNMIRVRLYGINTPELHSSSPAQRALATKAKQFAIDFLTGKNITIQTYKDRKEKYGRYLATIFANGDSLNLALITSGLAVEYLP